MLVSLRRNLRWLMSLAICLGACGCGGKDQPTNSKEKPEQEARIYEDDVNSFREWTIAFTESPHDELYLEDPLAWFGAHFSTDIAIDLANEYKQDQVQGERLDKRIAAALADRYTELRVRVTETPIDVNASGLQNAALQRMTNKTSLFSFELVQPGQSVGKVFQSFVFVDGRYRYLGPLSRLRAGKGDVVTVTLCERPLAMYERILQEKGLLDTSAAEHLNQAGILVASADATSRTTAPNTTAPNTTARTEPKPKVETAPTIKKPVLKTGKPWPFGRARGIYLSRRRAVGIDLRGVEFPVYYIRKWKPKQLADAASPAESFGLILDDPIITDADLGELLEHPNIRLLAIANYKMRLSPACLRTISNLKNLRILDLSSLLLGGSPLQRRPSMSALAELDNLEELRLSDSTSVSQLRPLLDLPNLKTLVAPSVSRNAGKGILELLARKKMLHLLDAASGKDGTRPDNYDAVTSLDFTAFKDQGTAYLSEFRNLQSLSIEEEASPIDLSKLQGLKHIRHLGVKTDEFSSLAARGIPQLDHLNSLEIRCKTLRIPSQEASALRVRSLSIHANSIDDLSWVSTLDLTNLRVDATLTATHIKAIAKCRSLENLIVTLRRNPNTSPQEAKEICDLLTGIRSLKCLMILDRKFPAPAVQAFRAARPDCLTYQEGKYFRFDNDQLRYVLQHQLEHVFLGPNKIRHSGVNDETLKILMAAEKMHLVTDGQSSADLFINLDRTAVTDDCIDDLLQLQGSIVTLDLSKTEITDRGLNKLLQHKRLRNLFIRGSKVTAEAVEAFRKAKPGCQVSFP